MLVKEETLAHALTLQKPYSLLSLFLIGDCFEHGKCQEETDDKERTRREKKKAQGETFEEVASIVAHSMDRNTDHFNWGHDTLRIRMRNSAGAKFLRLHPLERVPLSVSSLSQGCSFHVSARAVSRLAIARVSVIVSAHFVVCLATFSTER